MADTGVRVPRQPWWAAWLIAAVLALPTVLVRFPPMTDLALHAGGVGVLLHWHDEAFVPRGLYWFNPGHPNQLFYAIAYALCRVMGDRVGIGLTAALAQAGIVGGAAIFARHIAAPWWTALWVAPLALGWAYFWGLVPYLYGIALFLPALVQIDRLVTSPTVRRSTATAMLYVLLFFAHESALFAVLWVHLVLFALRSPRRSPMTAIAPAAFTLAFAFAHLIAVRGVPGPGERISFGPMMDRIGDLPGTIFGAYPLPIVLAMAAPFAGAALALRGSRGRPPAETERADRLWDQRFFVAGLGLLLAYFLAPAWLFVSGGVVGGWLNARFASYAWALLLPACAAGIEPTSRQSRRRRIAALMTGAAVVGPLFVAAPAFLESDRVNKALDRVMERMESGQAVIVHRLEPRDREVLYSSVSCGRVLELRGGRCDGDFTQWTLSPVRMTEGLIRRGLERRRDENQAVVLRPAEDLRHYRYMLLWTAEVGRDLPTLTRMLAPFARLVVEDGGWILFELTLPHGTPTTPELGPS